MDIYQIFAQPHDSILIPEVIGDASVRKQTNKTLSDLKNLVDSAQKIDLRNYNWQLQFTDYFSGLYYVASELVKNNSTDTAKINSAYNQLYDALNLRRFDDTEHDSDSKYTDNPYLKTSDPETLQELYQENKSDEYGSKYSFFSTRLSKFSATLPETQKAMNNAENVYNNRSNEQPIDIERAYIALAELSYAYSLAFNRFYYSDQVVGDLSLAKTPLDRNSFYWRILESKLNFPDDKSGGSLAKDVPLTGSSSVGDTLISNNPFDYKTAYYEIWSLLYYVYDNYQGGRYPQTEQENLENAFYDALLAIRKYYSTSQEELNGYASAINELISAITPLQYSYTQSGSLSTNTDTSTNTTGGSSTNTNASTSTQGETSQNTSTSTNSTVTNPLLNPLYLQYLTSMNNSQNVTTSNQANKSALNSLSDQVGHYAQGDVNDTDWQSFTSARDNAKSVLNSSSSTPTDVTSALDSLNSAVKAIGNQYDDSYVADATYTDQKGVADVELDNTQGLTLYDKPNGQPVADNSGKNRTLAYGSSWQSWRKATLSDGSTWLELGRNQWANAKYLMMENQQVATINYVPGYSVNLWSMEPDGAHFTGRCLDHGTAWKTFGSIQSYGKTYYNLGGNQWVDSDNVIISDKPVNVASQSGSGQSGTQQTTTTTQAQNSTQTQNSTRTSSTNSQNQTNNTVRTTAEQLRQNIVSAEPDMFSMTELEKVPDQFMVDAANQTAAKGEDIGGAARFIAQTYPKIFASYDGSAADHADANQLRDNMVSSSDGMFSSYELQKVPDSVVLSASKQTSAWGGDIGAAAMLIAQQYPAIKVK